MSDTRPETSPYGGNPIRFKFGGGSLTVTEGLLGKYPDLLHRLECNRSCWHPSSSSADLQHIPIAAGHVIVHHLFTGNYESLRSTGASVEEKCIAEFTTAIQVYIHAHCYELQLLETLASREVERLSKSLRATHIFRVIKEEYADPDINDVWFTAYVKRQVMSLYETPGMLLDPDVLESIVGDVPVTKFVIKAAFESFHELRESMKAAESAAEPAAEPNAPNSPANDLSPTWEHVPGQDATSKNKEFGLKDIATEPAPQFEPETASTLAFGPEAWPKLELGLPPEPVPDPAIEEDMWGSATPRESKKAKRRKKKLASFMEPDLTSESPPKPSPEMEPGPELVPEPEPEPAPMGDEDFWGSATKKKTKKEKMMATIVEPVPEPAPAMGNEDFWDFIPSKKGKKKGKETGNISIWDSNCESRAEHILDGDAWKECTSCREFLRERASQLE